MTRHGARILLQGVQRILEIEDLPESHTQIQQSESSDSAAHPARRHKVLQSVETGLTRGVEKKVVIPPIAQSKKALRNPRQERQDNANFQAKNNVKDDAEFRGHGVMESRQ